MAEPEHQRIAAGINQLVYPARLEAVREVDVRVGRDQRLLGTLIVETDPAFDAREAPAIAAELVAALNKVCARPARV